MTEHHSIIPEDVPGFHTYINRTTPYLTLGSPTNAARFNWPGTAVTFWQGIFTQWNAKYALFSDKKGSYTTDMGTDLKGIISKTVKYARENKLIELIRATLNLTSLDCSTFNLPATLAVPSTGTHILVTAKTKEADKTIATKEPVYVKIIPEAGGIIHIKAYPEIAESGRAHKLEGYDLLEYAIGVFNSGTSGLPTHATDPRLTIAHSSRANFLLPTVALTANIPLLAANAVEPLKMAVLFFRWAKSKHPNLDGPWNGPFTTPLL